MDEDSVSTKYSILVIVMRRNGTAFGNVVRYSKLKVEVDLLKCITCSKTFEEICNVHVFKGIRLGTLF